MDQTRRYRYEKRIKELEEQVLRLREYRNAVQRIGTTIGDAVSDDKSINTGWIIKQLTGLL